MKTDKKVINKFREDVASKLSQIQKLMADIYELDNDLTDKFPQDNGDSFFNNYLPIGSEYPFVMDWNEQILKLVEWQEAIIQSTEES